MRKNTAIDTDHLQLTRAVRAALLDAVVETDGDCQITAQPTIEVEGYVHKGRVGPRRVCIMRIAYAMANPHTHVSADEVVFHTPNCPHTKRGGRTPRGEERICIRPEHLVKGDRTDVAATKRIRGKQS